MKEDAEAAEKKRHEEEKINKLTIVRIFNF